MLMAVEGPYALMVQPDDILISPREVDEHFGTMVCFHSRYALGDSHNYMDKDDFLREMYAIIPIPGYVHLYRSLLRFYDMPENEVREMLYLLNTANLDCYEYYHPERDVIQSGPVAFSNWLEHMNCRPYRTEVQLYKSLLFLKRSIDRDLIVTSQREALQTLRCIISNLEYRFYKAYGMEIEDKRTVYGECTYRLVPREDEPSVCLMHDWIYLPSA